MKKIILSGFLSLMATTGLTSVASATTCSISGSIDFAYTGAIETCTVSQAGLYGVTAVGGGGGYGSNNYIGMGATSSGDIFLSSGEVINIIVGQSGLYENNNAVVFTGGGGSFVFQGIGSAATPLVVAGGSGGGSARGGVTSGSVTTSGLAGYNGGAGGVDGGNGGSVGSSTTTGGGGGGEGYLAILSTPTPTGGSFGGGGTTYGAGGGGGGYSGGGAGGNGYPYWGGGGGGSFVISTASSASITSPPDAYGTGQIYNGSVDFALINTTASSTPSNSVPEPSAIAVFASAIAGLVFARFWMKRGKA